MSLYASNVALGMEALTIAHGPYASPISQLISTSFKVILASVTQHRSCLGNRVVLKLNYSDLYSILNNQSGRKI